MPIDGKKYNAIRYGIFHQLGFQHYLPLLPAYHCQGCQHPKDVVASSD